VAVQSELQLRGDAASSGVSDKFFVRVQLAEFAGVVEWDVGVGAFVAVIDFAHVEGLE